MIAASPEVKLPPFLVGCKKHIADDLKLQVEMLAEPIEENPALIFIHICGRMCVDLPQCRQSAGIAAQDFFLDRRRKDSGQMQLYFCSISRPTVMIVRYIIEQLFRREAHLFSELLCHCRRIHHGR